MEEYYIKIRKFLSASALNRGEIILFVFIAIIAPKIFPEATYDAVNSFCSDLTQSSRDELIKSRLHNFLDTLLHFNSGSE